MSSTSNSVGFQQADVEIEEVAVTPHTTPSTRQLIQELAEIEDRMYLLRASGAAGHPTSPHHQELMRLAGREEQVLAQLRRQRVDH